MKEIKLSELTPHMGAAASVIGDALDLEATHLAWNGHGADTGDWEVIYVGPKLFYKTVDTVRWRREPTEQASYAPLPDLVGLRLGKLDDLVHEVFAGHASSVNNDGYVAQLECLRESGVNWDDIVEATKPKRRKV